MKKNKDYIGIDFGNCYSKVSIWKNNEVLLVPNPQGNYSTPNYLSFTENGILFGEQAKSEALKNPENTIFDIKRIIGRRYDDPILQKNIKYWPFTIIEGNFKRPRIVITTPGYKKNYYPEQILAIMLFKLKIYAEQWTGMNINNAVISIPSCFSHNQRKAILDSGAIAKIKAISLITRNTLNAIYFKYLNALKTSTNALFIHIGACSYSISTIIMKGKTIETKNSTGSFDIGGQVLTETLMKDCIEDFKNNYEYDLTNDKISLIKLRNACENAKKILSTSFETFIDIKDLHQGIDYKKPITREMFEAMNNDFFHLINTSILKALAYFEVNSRSIGEIFLTGATGRIPELIKMLHRVFRTNINLSLEKDYVGAIGLGVYGGKLSSELNNLSGSQYFDVSSYSIGSEGDNGEMAKFIKKNKIMPIRKTFTLTTSQDNQRKIKINLYEKTAQLIKDCNYIGTFTIYGIPLGAKGEPKIIITIDIDINGILKLYAEDRRYGNFYILSIKSWIGALSFTEIEIYHNQIFYMLAKDLEKSIIYNEVKSFMNYIENLERILDDNKDQSDYEDIKMECKREKEWIAENKFIGYGNTIIRFDKFKTRYRFLMVKNK
ncbi:hypothetical protein SteCoe_34936 [Stentor coeruleus]|uniref:Uncharacterized protein n=1 Tax=Stentor coeruleus TaxID=5963 RepID=A0A1R2ATS1_9CILI|nr:hypothetical protein SteCoe_34936 [Stentor coeruleus]